MADWPKKRTAKQAAGWTIYCCVCRKPIKPGQRYHYVSYKGRKVFHVDCYEKEVRGE